MPIEDIGYINGMNIGIGDLLWKKFHINSTNRPIPDGEFLTSETINDEVRRLLIKPSRQRIGVLGPMSRLIDPQLGRMKDDRIQLIKGVTDYLRNRDKEVFNCFEREEFGRYKIRSQDATVLDKLIVGTSHGLVILPGASLSPGTNEEILEGVIRRKSYIFLFDANEQDPDVKAADPEFKDYLRNVVANFSTHPHLLFVTYSTLPDLYSQFDEIFNAVHVNPVTDEVWSKVITPLKQEIPMEYLQ